MQPVYFDTEVFSLKIAFFDSGLGGLSVLHEARLVLPGGQVYFFWVSKFSCGIAERKMNVLPDRTNKEGCQPNNDSSQSLYSCHL